MNAYSSVADQETLAQRHRENIIYALTVLGEATSGEIKKFLDKKAAEYLESKYSSVNYVSADNELTYKDKVRDSHLTTMSKRTIQKWLVQLERNKLVVKNKYYGYKLTKAGRDMRIFGELYGRILFEGLRKIPLQGTEKQKVMECIKRLGVYMLFLFLQVKGPQVEAPLIMATLRKKIDDTLRSTFHRDVLELDDHQWLNDSFRPVVLFEWFNDNFYPDAHNLKNPRIDPAKYRRLLNILSSEYPQYYSTLSGASFDYITKVFPKLVAKEKERQTGPKS